MSEENKPITKKQLDDFLKETTEKITKNTETVNALSLDKPSNIGGSSANPAPPSSQDSEKAALEKRIRLLEREAKEREAAEREQLFSKLSKEQQEKYKDASLEVITALAENIVVGKPGEFIDPKGNEPTKPKEKIPKYFDRKSGKTVYYT